MYKVDKTKNAVFSLYYHLIIVVKYRKRIFINDDIISYFKTNARLISKNCDVDIIGQECGLDHVHILFRSKPTLDITRYVNMLKGISSRNIRAKYSVFLHDKLWSSSFWSPSYFLATTGNVTVGILKDYIENQK